MFSRRGAAMLGWFHQNNTTIYVLLGVALVILGALWFRTQDRRYARAGVGVAVLFALLFLFDLFGPESAGRQMKRKIHAMADAVRAKDIDRLFANISDSFAYGSVDKGLLRSIAQRALDSGEVTGAEVWNFGPATILPAQAGQPRYGTLSFAVKFKGGDRPQEPYFQCLARFVLDPDGQWRLFSFELHLMPGNTRFEPPQFPR
jgi:hypothetical protein